MWQIFGFAFEVAALFADAVIGVFQWSGRYGELAARVEPVRDRPAAADVTPPALP